MNKPLWTVHYQSADGWHVMAWVFAKDNREATARAAELIPADISDRCRECGVEEMSA
jgi:hypothetical protein